MCASVFLCYKKMSATSTVVLLLVRERLVRGFLKLLGSTETFPNNSLQSFLLRMERKTKSSGSVDRISVLMRGQRR